MALITWSKRCKACGPARYPAYMYLTFSLKKTHLAQIIRRGELFLVRDPRNAGSLQALLHQPEYSLGQLIGLGLHTLL